MNRLIGLALGMLLGVGACSDDPQRAPMPTAPPALSFSKASEGPTLQTTVCLSYLRERTRLQARLAVSPEDTALQRKATSYDRMLASACR